ncbi:MAG TPA: acyl-CoA thioesterase II [Bacteroidetes bacterium]|nr:acyl-CoA thioesterase II [Bacteroidota bacterium]
MKKIEDLIELLDLERIEENIFRGQSHFTSWKRVYGGQVLAQALHAAYQTVPGDRFVHSMHGYFILAGRIDMPIVYDVDRIRDGGSFTTRRIVAIQNGKAIFNAAASFQLEQEGLDHQISMPNVPPPETLVADEKIIEKFKSQMSEAHWSLYKNRPIEFRQVEKFDPLNQQKSEPFRHVWFRSKGQVRGTKVTHQELLAYASDYNLLVTAALPHLDQLKRQELFFASLDHAMWFHRDFRIDDWLLYAIDSPSASNSRGFARGNIFTRNGVLVASVVQEGLMRKLR